SRGSGAGSAETSRALARPQTGSARFRGEEAQLAGIGRGLPRRIRRAVEGGRRVTARDLRIALVGPLPPPSGGMANQTQQLARLLGEEGVKVEIVQVNSPYRP